MSDPTKAIVVAGDVCIDWFGILVPRVTAAARAPEGHVANWQLRDGMRVFARPGGAWLLADLVEQAMGHAVIHLAPPEPLEHQGCDDVLHSIIELGAFPRSNSTRDRHDGGAFVWRVERFRGFAGPASSDPPRRLTAIEGDLEATNLVVLDDVGNGFRHRPSIWPASLNRDRDEDGPTILWKLARPLQGGALGRHLLQKHARRTVVVLDVDDLRDAGASVSRRLSWERTAGDVIRALMYDATFAELRKARHIVVRLDLEGAMHVADVGADDMAVELTYLPSGIEGSTRAEVPGGMLGLTSVFVTMLARRLASAGTCARQDAIRDGIRAGLAASRDLFRSGFGPSTNEPARLTASAVPDRQPVGEFVQIPIAPRTGLDPASRLIEYVRRLPLERLADAIIEQGVAAVAGDAPVAKFAAFETLDRSEIEAYRSIRNLIDEYLTQGYQERPLSIAVFGPPGSGKSFGVAQVARTLGDMEKMEFNLSQFEDARQLTSAFHVVRDAAVRGRVPLVFFDEFDASAGGQAMGWLKHFLAPMQDGRFMDQGATHLIGRAIFVFAGGVRHTFAEFAQLRDGEFQAAKGPDFVSRLRGFVDVRGTDRREPNDDLHVVRRAVLLRSLLQRKTAALFDLPSGLLRIDPGVRRAFLRCKSFIHGARSMESIIEMSLLAGREKFEPASLPSEEQLSLHVGASEFLELVNQEVHLSEHREALGRAIHELFVRQQTGKKPADDPAMQPWDQLPEHYREDNRAQADDIPRKLALIGCGFRKIAPREQEAPKLEELTSGEVKSLAQAEHERWNDSKRLQGYKYGPGAKDDAKRTHPSLVPWSDLSDDERAKDYDTVREIPKLLESVGLEAYRLK